MAPKQTTASIRSSVILKELLVRLSAMLVLGCSKKSALGENAFTLAQCHTVIKVFHIIGQLTLSPMSVASVCRVGAPLQLTCTADVQNIKWNVLQTNEQGVLQEVTPVVKFTTADANQMGEREIDSVTFSFMRTSAQGALPLVSTLSIDSVGIALNGTVVRCSDVANQMISASTTIQVIDTSQSELVTLIFFFFTVHHNIPFVFKIIILLLSS